MTNLGNAESNGTITLTDVLPAGIVTTRSPENVGGLEGLPEWVCSEGSEQTTVTCTYEGDIKGLGYVRPLEIFVTPPSEAMLGDTLQNKVTVEGAGAPHPATATVETLVSAQSGSFEVTQFGLEADGVSGEPDLQAGGHPWSLTTTVGFPTILAPVGSQSTGDGNQFTALKQIKSVSVELPPGMVGNPLATPARCSQQKLREAACPPASEVGEYAVAGDIFGGGNFEFSGGYPNVSPIYNMEPEAGYPATFGLIFANLPVYMYASVVHSPSGYRLRVVAPGIPSELEASYFALTFFGDPGAVSGSGSGTAFLTNPVGCSAAREPARVEVESYSDPGHPAVKETPVYPSIEGCGALQFNPALSFAPGPSSEGGTTQADEPSQYTASLTVPQSLGFSETATPELRTATVSLPAGVTINPAAGAGLAGCHTEGPEGINIGSGSLGVGGRDEGDPEATELGAGHAGGNGSPYDDGVYHIAHGHCPQASIVGTAEVITPLLSAPLTGHIYLASPTCGGEGQAACTEASATNGQLFGAYLEAEGSGVIVKLPGSLSVNPQSGQITALFKENPQFPFSEVKLRIHGGPRAPFANPQSCGTATTSSNLEPWSTIPTALVSSAFQVTGCAATMAFAPSFTAGTTTPTAGALSPFTLTISRQDREQDLSGVTVTLPAGLIGMISQVPLCEEPAASQGACPASSRIGAATVTAGAGPEPLLEQGQVYLTVGYKGQPFGLSIVVPADAGPFHLGNVVVRAAIAVNPATAAVTVTSDPLPQSRDGVPFRLRTVNVTIERPGGFILNPTNCTPQAITATLSGEQGATSQVSSPFIAAGCTGLPFAPTFAVATQGHTSKANGASLTVKVTGRPGDANIRKLDIQLPIALPSRLTTLQKACTEAQFNTNPAGCPADSAVGTATAHTPILGVPLTGPAYLVSHGGAAFPDLEFVLQGQGVTIILDGKTDIKKGITYSNFETLPDAPVTSFTTTLPEGKDSLLAAYGSLCKPTKTLTINKHVTKREHGHLKHLTIKVKKTLPNPLSMPITIGGQNGAVIKRITPITVTECAVPVKPKAQKATSKASKKAASKAAKHKS